MADLGYTPYLIWTPQSMIGAAAVTGPVVPSNTIRAMDIRERQAPDITVATIDIELSRYNMWPWQWQNLVSHSSRIVVADPEFENILFNGHVTEVQWRTGSSISLQLTAVSVAARLDRDVSYMTAGRVMQSLKQIETAASPEEQEAAQEDPEYTPATFYNGIPLVFNKDYLPNCTKTNVAGSRLFTADNSPDAVYWTATTAIQYLLTSYPTGFWAVSPTAANTEEDEEQQSENTIPETEDILPEIDAEGKSLWQALGMIAEAAGWTVSLRHTAVNAGEPVSEIVIRDGSSEFSVYYDASELPTDPLVTTASARTNVHSISVTDTSSSSVAMPIILGGNDMYEMTIELKKAWDPDTDMDSDSSVDDPDWVAKYTTDGSSFADNRDVGRLWDANTDGYYSSYERDGQALKVGDVAKACGRDEKSWPMLAYKPCRMLGTGSDPEQAIVQYSVDGGSTWYRISNGVQIGKRLGVYISARNLKKICPPAGDEAADSLGAKLISVPDNVKLRLCCSVASPVRMSATPKESSAAGDRFYSSAVVDRGNWYQIRQRASTSLLASVTPADVCSYDTAYTAAKADATWVQSLNSRRRINASVAIESIATDAEIGLSIKKIHGIDYSLATGMKGSEKYPRIIGRNFLLADDTYKTELLLDGFREAGVI